MWLLTQLVELVLIAMAIGLAVSVVGMLVGVIASFLYLGATAVLLPFKWTARAWRALRRH